MARLKEKERKEKRGKKERGMEMRNRMTGENGDFFFNYLLTIKLKKHVYFDSRFLVRYLLNVDTHLFIPVNLFYFPSNCVFRLAATGYSH